jgi:hypothetical protein
VILEDIMRRLSDGEFKTLMAICRLTYGWGKPLGDRISLSQLAEMTGMDRSNVARARKRLGDLIEVTPGTATTASFYRLNIDISDADLDAIASDRSAASVMGSDPSATSDRSAASVMGSDPSATFQRKPKKEIHTGAKAPECLPTKRSRKHIPADPAQERAFARWYETYPRHVGRKAAHKAWMTLNPDPALTETIMAGTARYAGSVSDVELRFIAHPTTWLHGERWNDDLSNSNGNGHAKPLEVRDLGDGWLEVDGLRMSQKDYDRRYGKQPRELH